MKMTSESMSEHSHLDMMSKKLNAHLNFRDALNNMRKRKTFTNLTIVCGDKSYPVHKVVLCSACHYFSSLLTNELDDESTETVDLQGIDKGVFEVLLDFMYSGRFLLKDLPIHHIADLVPAIRKLGIFDAPEQLRNACAGLVDETNFDQMLNLADRLGSKTLTKIIHQLMIDKLVYIGKSKNILNLTEPQFQGFMMAASMSEVYNSDTLLEAALAWMRHHPERVPAFDSAIATFKFENLSDTFCRFVLEDEPLARTNSFLRKKLVYVLKDRSSTPRLPGKETLDPREFLRLRLNLPEIKDDTKNIPQFTSSLVKALSPRQLVASPNYKVCQRPSLAVIGRDDANRASIVFYSIRENEWTSIEDLGLSLDYSPGIVYHNDCIYFIGGESVSRHDKMSEAYVRDLVTKETTQLPDLRIPRSSPLVFCSDSGTLYAAGGVGRYGNSLSHVEGLDSIDSNSWRNIQSLREKRDASAVSCSLNGRIYVLGGGTRRCEFYQESTRSWHDLPSLPSELEQPIILTAAVNNHVYAFDYYKPQKIYRLLWEDEMTPNVIRCPSRMLAGGKSKGGGACEWEIINIRGQCPEWMTHATGFKDMIFVLDKSHRIYTFNTLTNTWLTATRLPKNLTFPCYFTTIL